MSFILDCLLHVLSCTINEPYYAQQVVREALTVAPEVETDLNVSENSLLQEASSSKTDGSEAQSSQTSFEFNVIPETDIPAVACQECKTKSPKITYLNRRMNRQNMKIITQRRKMQSQVNVSLH